MINKVEISIRGTIIELLPFEAAVDKIKPFIEKYEEKETQLNGIVAIQNGIHYYYFELYENRYRSKYGYTLSYDIHNFVCIYKLRHGINQAMEEHELIFKIPTKLPTEHRT